MKLRTAHFAILISLGIVIWTGPAKGDDSSAAKTAVSPGEWGGAGVEMSVTPQGATLEFDCAQGTISEPLRPDSGGKFRAEGTFRAEQGAFRAERGGPVKEGEESRGLAAVYTGVVHGDRMTLEVTINGNSAAPLKFELERGQSGTLHKCA